MFQAGYLPNIDENLFLISLTTHRIKPSAGQHGLHSEFNFFFFPAQFSVHKETLAILSQRLLHLLSNMCRILLAAFQTQ